MLKAIRKKPALIYNPSYKKYIQFHVEETWHKFFFLKY